MKNTVNIHGVEYQTVAYRLRQWREQHPVSEGWALDATILHHDADRIVVRAEIRDPAGRVVGSGHAEEYRSASNINRTSMCENAESSAWGRALAAVGYLGSGPVATADEVDKARRHEEAGQAHGNRGDEARARHRWDAACEDLGIGSVADYAAELIESMAGSPPWLLSEERLDRVIAWMGSDAGQARLNEYINGAEHGA